MDEKIELKTEELTGPALDWAVAKVEGLDFEPYFYRHGNHWVIQVVRDGYNPERKVYWFYPSTDWSHGGPLIEKYRPEFEVDDKYRYVSCFLQGRFLVRGETYLIAACRAIVAANLGDVVQVPIGLVRESESVSDWKFGDKQSRGE